MSQSFRTNFTQRHPRGITFTLRSDLLHPLFTVLKRHVRGASAHDEDDAEEETDRSSPQTPELLQAERKSVASWTGPYAHSRQRFSSKATLRYEHEQCAAIRLLPVESVNVLLRTSAIFHPDAQPLKGAEWTTVKQRKTPGIADLILTLSPSDTSPGSVRPTAVLKYNSRDAAEDSKMQGIERAADFSARGFRLPIDAAGNLAGKDDGGRLTDRETFLDLCLQIYAELHCHKVLYAVLFNSTSLLLFRPESPDRISVSRCVLRVDTLMGPNPNLASILLALGLLAPEWGNDAG